jgi:F420-dependent oxidoreductase-like protein
MRLGLQFTNFTWPEGPQQLGTTFARIAEHAERAGLYSLWTMDHLWQTAFAGGPEREVLEGWSALAYAAGRTNHIKLGVLVTGVTYRYPALLIKTATTLDVLSQGRSYFGIGAAWLEEEHHAYGIPFPPVKERFVQLEETLQIAHQMWSGDEKPYDGKYYRLQRPLNSPQAIQKPHPPIMIAGGGERKTLRLVAQYGDACNLFSSPSNKEELQSKLDVLREHCEAVGRPYEQIEKTVTVREFHLTHDGRNGTFSPAAAIDYFAELADMGVDHAIFNTVHVHSPETLDLLATEVVPAVEKISVAGR